MSLVYGLGLIAALNYVGSFVFDRLDLTQDKRYSLSDISIQEAKKLEDVIFVRVYLDGDLSADYNRLKTSTKELLDEYRSWGGDNIQYEFIDPSANPDIKAREKVYEKLVKEGLQPSTIAKRSMEETSEKVIFPGSIVTYRDKSLPWQLLKTQMGVPEPLMINNSIQQLEYQFISVVKSLQSTTLKKIAFIDGHGELPKFEVADMTRSLEEFYSVERIAINEQINALKLVDAIIIAGPDSAFTEKDKFIIDQFVMRGGKVLWLVENVSVTMDSLKNTTTTMAIPRDLNLDDQLFRYGVRVNRNLIMDLQARPIPIVTSQIGNTPRQEMLPWFYFPLVVSQKGHPIVKNLDAIMTEFASTIDFVGKDTAIKKHILLTSSDYTKLATTPARVSFNILREPPDKRQYNVGPENIAVLVEGTFTSNFKNRITSKIADNKNIAFKETSVPTRQIVISDADIIRNQINPKTDEFYTLGYDRFTRRIYANKEFILNCINYLMDDSGMLEIRAKEYKMRLLDRPRIEKEKTKWQIANTTYPIGIVIVLGIIAFIIRRKKYGA